MPEKPDLVPYVPGVIRGKKWVPPKQENIMEGYGFEDDIELDLDEDVESAFADAEAHDMVDLAAILGFHSMMTQEQWHHAHGTKWVDMPCPSLGWDGITKATPLKWYPPEEPNRYAFTECGKLTIFLSLRFFMKSILAFLAEYWSPNNFIRASA